MPIEGLSFIPQVRGKIRLGIKKESAKGVEYPSNTPNFNLHEVPEVAAVYGNQPTELHIQFLHNDMESIAPHYFMLFGGGHKGPDGKMKGGELWCKGDKITAQHFKNRDMATGITPERTCLGPDHCPDGKDCRPQLRLFFMLPLVDPRSIYEIDSNSMYNIKEIVGSLSTEIAFDRRNGTNLFTRSVFKLSKVSKQMKYFDAKSQSEKKSDNFILNIERYDNFFVEHSQKLLERDQRISAQLSYSPTGALGGGMAIQGGSVNLLGNNVPDANMQQIPQMGQTSDTLTRMKEIANDQEVVMAFNRLAELVNRKLPVETTRLATVRKFETKPDPRSAVMEYLNAEINKALAKTQQAPQAPQAPQTPAPQAQEPTPQAPSNEDGII